MFWVKIREKLWTYDKKMKFRLDMDKISLSKYLFRQALVMYLEQTKKIEQNWIGLENFGIFFLCTFWQLLSKFYF